MKHAKLIIALTLTMSPLLAAAQLTRSDKIVTKVPFEFTVDSKTVPAGEWAVQSNNDGGSILRISNWEQKVTLLSIVNSNEAGGKPSTGYGLVFYKYSDRYFLRGVMVDGSRIVYRLPESEAEKELRAQNISVREQILIAARE